MGRKSFSAPLSVVCLLLAAAAVGLAIYPALPKTSWYRFTFIGLTHTEETRQFVWDYFNSDVKWHKFWNINFALLIGGIGFEGILVIELLATAIASRGTDSACARFLRITTIIVGILGLACFAGCTVFFASQHQHSVRDCEIAEVLPWCKNFVGSDTLKNSGAPGAGWMMVTGSAALSLASAISVLFLRPHRHYITL